MLVVDGGPNDGRTIILAKSTVSMGRLADNDLVVNEPAVSRRHAEITHSEAGGWPIRLWQANLLQFLIIA